MSITSSERSVIESCSHGSLAGERTFPEVVAGLASAGVGSYLADYRRGETTYYASAGETVSTRLPDFGEQIAAEFDAAALREAIGAAQRNEIWYPEFLKRSRAGGCVGYIVWIEGRHVTYFGRRGETHVERFPGADGVRHNADA